MNATPLLMRCITHLHAGSEDSGVGIIDKMVQRDPATGLPCVHASSLKGSIKQFAAEKTELKDHIKTLFGSDTSANKGGEQSALQQGQLAFLPARLLCYPAQGEKQPYFLVTSKAVLNEWADELEILGGSDKGFIGHIRTVANAEPGTMIGLVAGDTGRNGDREVLKKCAANGQETAFKAVMDALNRKDHQVKEGFAVISDGAFIDLTDDFNLPVVARNALDDGQSENLWYEQLVPSRSIFSTALLPMKEKLEGLQDLTNAITASTATVQVGANASVGMGLGQFKPV